MKINIKMERDTIVLKLDSERTYEMQKSEIRECLFGLKSFLKGGDAKVSYDGLQLTFEEEMDLCSIADRAFETRVDFCYKNSPSEDLMRHVLSNGEHFVKKVDRTVRAGEIIKSNGDILVIGDVNPTAQLVAYGDVYVIGNLRGIAHAGCGGDKKAVIYAMNMNPVILKIADKIGFNSEMSKRNSNGIARLENDEIKVNMI